LSEVLVGTSLEVKAGTVVALIGAYGAGKTTTMRAISGLVSPAGSVLLDGQPVQGLPASRIARLGLAHSPEGAGLRSALGRDTSCWVPTATAALFGLPCPAGRDLDRVSNCSALARAEAAACGTLSGGEQQWLAIPR